MYTDFLYFHTFEFENIVMRLSKFKIKNMYFFKIVHVFILIPFHGLDLPKSNDPHEVVQNIMFKQHMTVLGKEVMDVVGNHFHIFDFKIILQMCFNSKSKL